MSYVFTVWYIYAPVACDSRYTPSTVRKLTPRAAVVLSRGLPINIIILPAFFSIWKNVLTLQIASFMSFDRTIAFGMMMAYFFRIYWNGHFHKESLHCDLLHSCVAIVTCLVRFILKTSNANWGHYKNKCTPLLKDAVSEIMLTTIVN